MSVSEGVTVTVAWVIKPELADTFVESLRGMFPETRLRNGFRNVRLLKSDVDANQFLLIKESDESRASRTMLSSGSRPATRKSCWR